MKQTKHLFSRKPYGYNANNTSMNFTKWWIGSLTTLANLRNSFSLCRRCCGKTVVYFIFDNMEIAL
jgi:hypothetical protein